MKIADEMKKTADEMDWLELRRHCDDLRWKIKHLRGGLLGAASDPTSARGFCFGYLNGDLTDTEKAEWLARLESDATEEDARNLTFTSEWTRRKIATLLQIKTSEDVAREEQAEKEKGDA